MEPIRSSFEDDPDMVEIVGEFVADAVSRADELEAQLQTGDLSLLRTLAHQLKGCGGGYGFDVITERAADLEATLSSGTDEATVKEKCGALCETLRAIQAPEAK